MRVTSTEIKVSYTIREAQSLVILLAKVNQLTLRNQYNPVLTGVPQGCRDDYVEMEHELRNLLDVKLGISY